MTRNYICDPGVAMVTLNIAYYEIRNRSYGRFKTFVVIYKP